MASRKIAVIDGNSLIHRAFHAVQAPMNTPDGTPTNAVFGFMQMLLKLIEDHQPDGIICAWDVHRPEWRMKLLEKYKAQRPPMDKALSVQFPLVQGLLEAMNIPCIKMEGFEGDDILGTFARIGEEEGKNIYLITGDKDAYQLASETTTIVTTKKGMSDIVMYTPEKVVERYGIGPELVPDYLGLKGDSSDNIPGVPGVGEKTASKLLVQYGSLDGIFEHANEIKGKMGERLREHEEDARVSKAVATIRRDAPVDLKLDDVHFPDFDTKTVTEAFGALHFNRHLRTVLSLANADGQGAASSAMEQQIKLSYHMSKDAKRFVDAAIKGERWIAVSLDEPAEQTLFEQESLVVFSDGAGLAQLACSESKDAVNHILAEGKLVGHDLKTLLRTIYGVGADALDCSLLDASRLFDIDLAAYLLESDKRHSVLDLVEKYLGLSQPSGDDAPTHGQFESAAMLSLMEQLRGALSKDGADKLFDDIEMPLSIVLLQMELTGVQISTDVLEGISSGIAGRVAELKEQIVELAGEDFNVDSPMQLSHILFGVLGLDTKKSKKGKKVIKHDDGTEEPVYSTNAAVLEKLQYDHPLPAKVVEYRELAKLKSTYLDALPRLVSNTDGRIHTTFNQTVTATGRLSSSEPNLQNIPVRTELGRQIREAFVAPENGVFVSADYSQIELRLLAHLSEDAGLIAAFNSGEDFHAHTAAGVFDVAVEDVTPEMRSRAKAVNFGIVYGQQAFGLGQSLHIPMVEAQEMIDRYYAAYPRVRAYLDETVAQAHEEGFASTMFGRKRHIAELGSSNPNMRRFGERTAMNHPMQGTAADIIKLAMIKVQEKIAQQQLSARMVLQVHDELDFECPNEEVDVLVELVRDVMNNVVELKVPLIADVETGPNWAIAH